MMVVGYVRMYLSSMKHMRLVAAQLVADTSSIVAPLLAAYKQINAIADEMVPISFQHEDWKDS